MTTDTKHLRALLEAATPGPFEPGVCFDDDKDKARDVYLAMFDAGTRDHFFNVYPVPQDERMLAIAVTGNGPFSDANARLIAALLTAAPGMIEELERLRTEAEERADSEAARWQRRIEDTIARAGLEPFDASGNESGDPLDWTDDQVGHALETLREELSGCEGKYMAQRALKEEAQAERDQLRAEVERLRDILRAHEEDMNLTLEELAGKANELQVERDQLRAEVERLRQFGAAYDDEGHRRDMRIAELEAEVARLNDDRLTCEKRIQEHTGERNEARAEVERLRSKVTRMIDAADPFITGAEAERDRLRVALEKYGTHLAIRSERRDSYGIVHVGSVPCPGLAGGECLCGFIAAIAGKASP
jgi:hypothetical protein